MDGHAGRCGQPPAGDSPLAARHAHAHAGQPPQQGPQLRSVPCHLQPLLRDTSVLPRDTSVLLQDTSVPHHLQPSVAPYRFPIRCS